MTELTFTFETLSLEDHPETPITVNIICTLRENFTVTLAQGSSARDLYIEVSAHTSLSKTFFKLVHEDRQLFDGFLLLREHNIKNGSNIYLSVYLQSGLLSVNFTKLSKTRKAIRSYIFAMTPEEVKKFFEAQHTLYIKVPVSDTVGTLRFNLDKPMSEDPSFYMESLARARQTGPRGQFLSFKELAPKNYEGKFYGDLAPDVYNSKGIPGKTVDTIISIMEGLLDSV